MATNQILNILDWLLVGSVSQPPLGFSKIYPKKDHSGLSGSWYVTDDVGSEKRLAFDIDLGAGISFSYPSIGSPYGTRIDVQIGGGLTYSQGIYQSAPFSVWGLTPSMLSITGSFQPGYVLSISTVSGEFSWVQNATTIIGPTNTIPKFDGTSLTSSRMVDTGSFFYIGSTPSITNASFSVDHSLNIGKDTEGTLYFGDQLNNYIKGENAGGIIVRTTDEFIVELFTSSTPTYKILDFDTSITENKTLKLMNSMVDFGDFTQSKYLSASNINEFTLGKTSSQFLMTLSSNTQGALKIVDGNQASYSLLYSESSGLAKWGKLYGYNGLTTSELGVGLNLVNIQGLTYSGITFGLDYSKFDLPIKVYDTFTISLATVSVITGITYGSTFETPSFTVDQWGRIIGIGTVSTSAFTGPQGPTGFSFIWSGSYATSSTYSLYNVVEYQGSSYISLGTSSPGLTPSTSTQSWELMASRGDTGPQGLTGQGFTWQGTYVTASNYSFYDVVYYEGSSYISLGTTPPGLTPSTITQSWDILALGGSGLMNISGTFGSVLVYDQTGWTALGPATAGYLLTSGGTVSLPFWSEPLSGSASIFTFSRGFTVSLNTGPQGERKWFGKYKDGDFINAIGMTIEELINDVITDIKPPIVNIDISNSPKHILFGAVGATISLSFNYTILNAGATAVGGTVSLSVSDPQSLTDIWSGLTSSNTFQYPVSFNRFTTPSFTFTYTVTDDKGGVGTDSDTISVLPYEQPTLSISITSKANLNTQFGETSILRERGKVGSNIVLSYTRESELLDVNTYSLVYTRDGDPEILLYTDESTPNGESGSISEDHDVNDPINNPSLSLVTEDLSYRYSVQDDFATTLSSLVTVTFEQLFFFGPTVSTPTNRSGLLTLPNIKLRTSVGFSNPFEFNTGTSLKTFVIAIPDAYKITSILSRNATGGIETSVVESLWQLSEPTPMIEDFAGNNILPYKIYTITNLNPYNPANIWKIQYGPDS